MSLFMNGIVFVFLAIIFILHNMYFNTHLISAAQFYINLISKIMYVANLDLKVPPMKGLAVEGQSLKNQEPSRRISPLLW